MREHFLPILQAGWPAGWLVGWPAASSASGIPKCIKNAYPYHESASKTLTLRQKVDVEPREVAGGGGQNRVPLDKKCVKNMYP